MGNHQKTTLASAQKTVQRVAKLIQKQPLGTLSIKALNQWLAAMKDACAVLIANQLSKAIKIAQQLQSLLQTEIERRLTLRQKVSA